MKRYLFILFSLLHTINWAQDVDILLRIKSFDDQRPVINQEIWLISDKDTLIKNTNLDGLVLFSSADSIQPLQLNKEYQLISKNGTIDIFGEETIETFVTKNTHLVREFWIYNSTCLVTPKIYFTPENWRWTKDVSIQLDKIQQLLTDNENLIIAVHAMINDLDNYTQGMSIATLIRDSLIARDIPAEKIKLDFPHHMENTIAMEDHITFSIVSFEYYPCVGLRVINFDITRDVIIETRCESLKLMYKEIMSTKDDFAIIGIYHNREDQSHNEHARQRAELVINKLIDMGVPKNKMEVFTQYYPEPQSDDYRDWPFYPRNYSYEIGVVLNLAP